MKDLMGGGCKSEVFIFTIVNHASLKHNSIKDAKLYNHPRGVSNMDMCRNREEQKQPSRP